MNSKNGAWILCIWMAYNRAAAASSVGFCRVYFNLIGIDRGWQLLLGRTLNPQTMLDYVVLSSSLVSIIIYGLLFEYSCAENETN